MTYRPRFWALTTAAALGLIGVEEVTVVRMVPGDAECWQYGFPFPFTQDFSGTSLDTLLEPRAFIIDWLVYTAAIAIPLALALRRVAWSELPRVVRASVVVVHAWAALGVVGEAGMTAKTTQMSPSDGAPRAFVVGR